MFVIYLTHIYMKKIPTVLFALAVGVMFFMLSGCNQNVDDMHGADLKTSVLTVEDVSDKNPIAMRVDNEKLYKLSQLKSLGFQCSNENQEALDVLNKLKNLQIFEMDYTHLKQNSIIIYRTQNPTGIDVVKLKDVLNGCGNENGLEPLEAEDDYILWGNLDCAGLSGQEENKCKLFVKKLKQYLN